MKRCADCLQYKPLEGFYKGGGGHPNRRCRICEGAYRAMRRAPKPRRAPLEHQARQWKTSPPEVDPVAARFCLLPRCI